MEQKVIFMVGPYYSGKTAYIQKQFESGKWKRDDFVVLSINNFIENHAKEFNLSHDGAYNTLMATAHEETSPLVKITRDKMIEVIGFGKNVVINNPNINQEVRKIYLEAIPEGISKEAVCFVVKNFRPWLQQIKNTNSKHKSIPLLKAFHQRKSMVEPSEAEGFDAVMVSHIYL